MSGINKVIILGNVARDPELKEFANGGKICNLSIATSETWVDKNTNEKRETTEFHNVVFNGRLADVVAQYLVKGSKAYVEGKITTRKWTDKDGNERYSTEIRADKLEMLGSGNKSQSQPKQQQQQGGYSQAKKAAPDDDLPF